MNLGDRMSDPRSLRRAFLSACLALCFGCAEAPGTEVVALVGATLIDGTGAPPLVESIVLLEGEHIRAVAKEGAIEIPAGSTVVDLSGRWIVPGLIEANGHVTFDGQIDHAAFFARHHDRAFDIGAENLRTALDQGVTTIRDTHGPTASLFELRDAVDAGTVVGSRLFTSGAILNYESLLDIPSTKQLDEAQVARAREQLDLFIEGEEQGRAVIAKLHGRQADFVKISLSGRLPGAPPPQRLSDEVLTTLLDEAQRRGLRTTTHTMNVTDLQRAVALGFDALEHPAFTLQLGEGVAWPEGLAERIAEAGIFSVPLLVAMEVYITFLEEPERLEDERLAPVPSELLEDARAWLQREGSDPSILASRRARYAVVRDNLRQLIAAGAPIAMGTDRGTRLNYHEHANHVRELEIYVELGMTKLEALRSATLRGAEILGVEDRLGSIEPGKLADLLVLRADPLTDLRALDEVAMVFQNGARVDGGGR